ncbi:MAG: hypothetical protein ACK5MG_05250 [Bacteroidales bacterium]
MDDFLYYLLIIGVVLYQLFGAFSKNDKKKSVPEDADTSVDVKEILGRFLGVDNNNIEEEDIPTVQTVSRVSSRPSLSSTVLDDVSREEGRSLVRRNDLSSYKRKEDVSTGNKHRLLRDFSIDKAVIYSEIIKPKYF